MSNNNTDVLSEKKLQTLDQFMERVRFVEHFLYSCLSGEKYIIVSRLDKDLKKILFKIFGLHSNFTILSLINLIKSKKDLKQETLPILNAFLDDCIKQFSNMGKNFTFNREELNHISADDVLFEDFNCFSENLKRTNLKYNDIMEKTLGLNKNGLYMSDIAKEYGISRERIRQINKKIVTEMNMFSRVSPDLMKSILEEALDKGLCIENLFPKVRSIFGTKYDFYFFMEKISHMDEMFCQYLSEVYTRTNLFEEFCWDEKLPLSVERTKEIIAKKYKRHQTITDFIFSNLISENKLKVNSKGVIPLDLYISTMFAQAALYFPNGATFSELQNKLKEIFDYTLKNEIRIEATQVLDADFVYLYGKKKARHVVFFNEENSESFVASVLKDVQTFLQNNNDCNVSKIRTEVFKNKINYYDLRYIIRRFGEDNNLHPIYFNGHGNKDSVFLDGGSAYSLKQSILNVSNKAKSSFKMEQVINEIGSKSGSRGSIATAFGELLKAGKIIKYDASNFANPKIAFKGLSKKDKKDITLCIKTHTHSGKPMTVAYLGKIMTENLKINKMFHKYFYLSFIRHYHNEFKDVTDNNANLLFFNNPVETFSFASFVKMKYQENNGNKKKTINDIHKNILCTSEEIEMAMGGFPVLHDNTE